LDAEAVAREAEASGFDPVQMSCRG